MSNQRYVLGSEPSSGQNFQNLRNYYNQRKILYEDNQFCKHNFLICRKDTSLPPILIEWKRPGEICENPQLFVEGFGRFDVRQGKLGDCWMLSAMATLTMHSNLFFQVVPQDQGFESHLYAGIFHFCFWQFGEWVEVIIDDRLPTYQGKLIYLSSSEKNEFWSPLLEKAYAKLHGSYDALIAGVPSEAMEDFTGGVSEIYCIKEEQKIYDVITKSFEQGSMICSAIIQMTERGENRTDEGLVENHAFSVIDTHLMNIQTQHFSGRIKMIKVRNPWGNKWEWNGLWSDNSIEWQFISESEKNEMKINFMEDGEFWMPYVDFMKYFTFIEICNLTPCALDRIKNWEFSSASGQWIIGKSAGGCSNNKTTFHSNPQFILNIQNSSHDKTVVITLMQKRFRYEGLDRYKIQIGFTLYTLNNTETLPLTENFFESHQEQYSSEFLPEPRYHFVTSREITTRFQLQPGRYCIIPSTLQPNCSKEFLLRVFSKQKFQLKPVQT